MSDVISLNVHFSIVQLTPRPLKIFAFSQNMAITPRIRGIFEKVPGGPIFLSYTHLADSNRPQRSARRTVSLSTSRRCERLLEGRVGDQDFAARPACP